VALQEGARQQQRVRRHPRSSGRRALGEHQQRGCCIATGPARSLTELEGEEDQGGGGQEDGQAGCVGPSEEVVHEIPK
jgi:hypothetical protein